MYRSDNCAISIPKLMYNILRVQLVVSGGCN